MKSIKDIKEDIQRIEEDIANIRSLLDTESYCSEDELNMAEEMLYTMKIEKNVLEWVLR